MRLSNIVAWGYKYKMKRIDMVEVNRPKYKWSLRGISFLGGIPKQLKQEVNSEFICDTPNGTYPCLFRDYEKGLFIYVKIKDWENFQC